MHVRTYIYNMEIAVKATHVHIEWKKTTAIRDKADFIEWIYTKLFVSLWIIFRVSLPVLILYTTVR